MKTLLLIAAAAVALGAGPVLAAGAKTMQSSGKMTYSGKVNQAVGADGRIIRGSRAQMDAAERPVTQQLNLEAQAAAGVPGATATTNRMGNAQTGMISGGAATGGVHGRPEGAQATPAPRFGAPARGETPNSPTSTGEGTGSRAANP